MRHLTEHELAGFLDQDLSPEERLRVDEHLDSCEECREELVAVTRLVTQAHEGGSSPEPAAERRGGWRLPVGIAGVATAAAVATVLLVQPGDIPLAEPTPELERSIAEGVEQLTIHAPSDDAVVSREELRFVWADRGTDSYRITIAAEDGAPLWSHSLADTTVAPPEGVELPPGTRMFWYVDAISAGVVARTGARSFRIVP